MTKESARLMLKAATAAAGHLDQALAGVQRAESHEDFKGQRTAVANVLGSIYFEVLKPLLDEHPDLAAEWLRFPPNPDSSPTE